MLHKQTMRPGADPLKTIDRQPLIERYGKAQAVAKNNEVLDSQR
ncbi:hypothetical protein ACFWHB_11060 [Aeromonas mytilicola subsp. aquatica]